MQTPKVAKQRMIHIRLSEDIHKELRIAVAEKDTSIQEFTAVAITKELKKLNNVKRSKHAKKDR